MMSIRRRAAVTAIVCGVAVTSVPGRIGVAPALAAEPASTRLRTTVAVRFERNGTCEVLVGGPEAGGPERAALQTAGRHEPAALEDFECRLPPVSPAAGVDLVVMLPAGAAPAGADFPRLSWQEHAGVWSGRASLPAAPAFVRVAQPSSALPRRAHWLDAIALAATALAILVTLLYSARSAETRNAVRR